MSKLICLAAMLFLAGCTGEQQHPDFHNQVRDQAPGPDLGNRDSSYLDYWCSADILNKTEQNLERLDLILVADFMASFHADCQKHHGFRERANDLLFQVIRRKPDRVLELLSKNSSLSRTYIVYELAHPVRPQPGLDSVIVAIQKLNLPDDETWKEKTIRSLETAKMKK